MKEDSSNEDDDGRLPALSLNSPWAWFYYSTFGVQIVVVTAYILRYQVVLVTHDTALETYISTLLGVSAGVSAMAAYSLLIAVTVEATRMIAERYLAKRFRQGKKEGIAEGKAQVLGMLDEDTRKEVERRLRRNGNSNHLPQDN